MTPRNNGVQSRMSGFYSSVSQHGCWWAIIFHDVEHFDVRERVSCALLPIRCPVGVAGKQEHLELPVRYDRAAVSSPPVPVRNMRILTAGSACCAGAGLALDRMSAGKAK